MEEIWKDIKGYEGIYQVSNLGRIRSLDRYLYFGYQYCLFKGNIKRQSNLKGYKTVMLSKNNHNKRFLVHRLVGIAFIENINNKPQIDHINGIKYDNRVENLRWVTDKENSNFPIARENSKNALRKYLLEKDNMDYIRSHKEESIPIKCTNLKNGNISYYISIRSAFRNTGCSRSTIKDCLKYPNKQRKRFLFEKINNPDRDGILIAEYARRKNL